MNNENIVYTPKELQAIKVRLRPGDVQEITTLTGISYNYVTDVLNGNRNKGLSKISKRGLKVVEEALRLIEERLTREITYKQTLLDGFVSLKTRICQQQLETI